MVKQAFIDLETTGVDPMKNGIYWIGGIIRYKDVYEEFELKCDLYQEDEVNPEAFENAKIKPEEIASFPDPYETYKKLTEILSKHIDKYKKDDKFFFTNFGAEFDSKFLRRWFESNGDNYYGSWFWHPPIEVQSLAMEYLKNERAGMKNFKLSTVATQCLIAVDEDKTHTPLYDAKLAMQIYDLCSSSSVIKKANDEAQEISRQGVYHLKQGERRKRA